ncbi:MAG: LysM peptidoglycan-binding domain-containing protein [Chitinophagia bacterium]|nr:LysM peptidoglycan-binding domain-containing protein [Chitinophagia bacterium]
MAYFYILRHPSGIPKKTIRMKRFTPVLAIILAACLTTHAQASGPLMPERGDGKVWLRHTVAPKENWYSVARLYHIGPRDIAAFNATDIAKALTIGQTLRIPLTEANFAQSGKPAADEAFVPLYHLVAGKEGLYRIGQEYNGIGIEALKALNGMTSDAVKSGSRLVIGFLRVSRDQNEWAGRTLLPAAAKVTPPVNASEKIPSASDVKATAEKKPEPPVATPRRDTVVTRSTPSPKVTEPVRSRVDSAIAPGGYFAALYAEQSKSGSRQEQSGTVAPFKSTSGWKDGKYYLLMSGVVPGTVVRVTNPTTGRSIHAKVLGDLPPIRENEKVTARMSNAAYSALQLAEGGLELRLEWMRQ